MRIAMVGAGSLEFCGPMLRSLLPVAARHRAALVLCDKEPRALADILAIARRLADSLKVREAVAIDAVPDMAAAVAEADYVTLTLNHGGHAADQQDLRNALEHGLRCKMVDTIGPGSWFRALRQGELLHRLLAAMRPEATLLNTSNPLSFLGRMTVRAGRQFVGFCHGPATRVRTIAGWLGLDATPDYTVFGTNHLSWLTALERDGEDLLPRVLRFLESEQAPAGWRLNRELLARLGTMPCLEGQHTADFFPGLNDPEALAAYGLEVWDPAPHTSRLAERLERRAALASGALSIDSVGPSPEGVELVLDALAGGPPHRGVYNVALESPANGLPAGSIAESWLTVEAGGCRPDPPPRLPQEVCDQLARLARQQDLVAQACESASPAKLVEALLLEPNLPSEEVAWSMVRRALSEHAGLLGPRWEQAEVAVRPPAGDGSQTG